MFVLENVSEVVARTKIFKLVEDDVCQFDEFCKEIRKNGNMNSDLVAAFRIMNDFADGKALPKVKFRKLKGYQNIYEVKKNLIRIYLITPQSGKIIVLGSKKGDQDTDINRVAGIQKRYLESL